MGKQQETTSEGFPQASRWDESRIISFLTFLWQNLPSCRYTYRWVVWWSRSLRGEDECAVFAQHACGVWTLSQSSSLWTVVDTAQLDDVYSIKTVASSSSSSSSLSDELRFLCCLHPMDKTYAAQVDSSQLVHLIYRILTDLVINVYLGEQIVVIIVLLWLLSGSRERFTSFLFVRRIACDWLGFLRFWPGLDQVAGGSWGKGNRRRVWLGWSRNIGSDCVFSDLMDLSRHEWSDFLHGFRIICLNVATAYEWNGEKCWLEKKWPAKVSILDSFLEKSFINYAGAGELVEKMQLDRLI